MRKIPLTRGKFTLVDDEDYDVLSKHRWHLLKGKKSIIGYAVRWSPMVSGKRYHISMAREILQISKDKEPDHIDRNSLDNRRCNLRVVSRKENNDNRRSWGKSKVKWVQWDRFRNLW